MLLQAFCIISQPSVESNWIYSPETPNSGQNRRGFVLCDLIMGSLGCVFIDNETHESGVTKCTTGEA